jgi:HPt (histidine-containing phosphotransfer) domain-containing protein
MVSLRRDEEQETPESAKPGSEASDTRSQVVDLTVLHRATGGDRALQREVVQMFAEQLAAKLEVIRRAVAEHDTEALRRASHTLLGSCTTLGAVRMADLLVILEQAAETASFEALPAVCANLATEADRSLRFLEQSVLSS